MEVNFTPRCLCPIDFRYIPHEEKPKCGTYDLVIKHEKGCPYMEEIKRRKQIIVAVDFDGTLNDHSYPDIGEPRELVISLCKKLKEQGVQLILWTCRSGDRLQDAIDWAKFHGVEFDAINDDVPQIKDSKFGQEKSAKVFAHYYIDDKNVSVEQARMMIAMLDGDGYAYKES